MNKTLSIIAIILSVVALIVSVKSPRLGGTTAGYWNAVSGFQISGTTVIDSSRNLSNIGTAAITGTLTVSGETNLDTLVHGGDLYEYTTSGSITLTAAQVCDNSIIRITPTAGAINVTLPSTTTLAADCLPTVGDMKIFLYSNEATAATNTTIVAGTGMTL